MEKVVFTGSQPATAGDSYSSLDSEGLWSWSDAGVPETTDQDGTSFRMGHLNRPLRLAIVDDYAVVVAGVASFLAAERINVVETDASLPVITDVDIVLYDTFAQIQGVAIDLEDFVRDSGAKVVIYSWNTQPEMIREAMAGGASGYLSKVLTGPEVVAALERVMSGETVILPGENETSVGGVDALARPLAGAVTARGRSAGPDHTGAVQSGDR